MACGDDETNEVDTSPIVEEPTEEVNTDEYVDEVEDEDIYNPQDTMVGSITDLEPIRLKDYDDDKWAFFDSRETGEFVESAAFEENGRLYLGLNGDKIVALDFDSTIFWEDEMAATGFQTNFMMDEIHIYSPSMTGNQSDKNYIAALSKETGERNYQIDLSEYGEMSEFLVDDDALYVVLGINEDEDESYLEDNFSLHKFDKVTGERLWEIDINGIKLGHGRAHYYVLQQNDELIFLLEKTEDDLVQIVARSKVDGTEVWTTVIGNEDDRLDGARLGRIYHSNGAIYIIDGYNMIHVFDDRTGENIAVHPFNGYQPGGMVPLPIVSEDIFIWQHGTEDYHHMKAVNPKTGEDLWVIDMAGHFLVDYGMVGDTLYAFFGSLDYDAEESTFVVRINPETGEMMDSIQLGASISAKLNNFYVHMGLTESDDNLVYFYDNLVYLFKE